MWRHWKDIYSPKVIVLIIYGLLSGCGKGLNWHSSVLHGEVNKLEQSCLPVGSGDLCQEFPGFSNDTDRRIVVRIVWDCQDLVVKRKILLCIVYIDFIFPACEDCLTPNVFWVKRK